MAFGSRNRHGGRRPGSPDFDLLTTIFGLPNRHTLECERRQRARRVVLSYVTDDDQHVGVQERQGSSGSESTGDRNEQTAGSASGTDDNDEQVEVRQVAVKMPRRLSIKKASVGQRFAPKKALEHRETRQTIEAVPEPDRAMTLERSKLRKQRNDKPTPKASKAPRAPQISSPPPSTTRRSRSKHRPTIDLQTISAPQMNFVPQPPFGMPIQPAVQNPMGLQPQPQQQFGPHGYYCQPAFTYTTTANTSPMVSYTIRAPVQEWNTAPYQPQPVLVPVGLNHATAPKIDKSGPVPNAEELDKIQNQIDGTAAQLQQEPRNDELNSRMRSLQTQLNEALNKATAHRNKEDDSSRRRPSPEKSNQASKSITAPQKDSDERSPANSTPDDTTTALKDDDQQPSARQQPEIPNKDTLRHRCYGCGNTRSMWYHEKYPIDSSRRVRNLCEGCRDDMIQGGLVGQRHFCFGCGRARSSKFHRKKPAVPGDNLLLSYCKHCEDDMRTADATTNASVGDSVSFSGKVSDHFPLVWTDHAIVCFNA